jgi:hypothetical protein
MKREIDLMRCSMTIRNHMIILKVVDDVPASVEDQLVFIGVSIQCQTFDVAHECECLQSSLIRTEMAIVMK